MTFQIGDSVKLVRETASPGRVISKGYTGVVAAVGANCIRVGDIDVWYLSNRFKLIKRQETDMLTVKLDYDIADKITVDNLKEAHKTLREEIAGNAFNYAKDHERENLRNNAEYLIAVEKVLQYFVGVNWNDN
jgi:hypothetical protein